ncbi:hypothetical protein AB0D85_28205, partial [Streptomyces sp. NPDC048277]
PDDSESVKSGSAGGREEKELPRQTPRHAADPTAWLLCSRRMVRDYERRTDTSEAVIRWSMTTLMSRRLAAHHQQRPAPAQTA